MVGLGDPGAPPAGFPKVALVITNDGFEAFRIAMAEVPELKAWLDYGYHLFPSPRRAAAFRRAMEEHRPWDAFDLFAGDHQAWANSSAVTFKPWWP